MAVEKSRLFDPSLGLVNKILADLGRLDDTRPERLEDVENLTAFGKMKRRWTLLNDLASEAPEMLSERATAQLDSLGRMVEHIQAKLDRVVRHRPK